MRSLSPTTLLSYRRMRRLLPMILAVTICLVVPCRALANPTFVSTGGTTSESMFEVADRADCVIVGDWRNAVFSTSDPDSIVYRTPSYTMANGETQSRGVFFKRSIRNNSYGSYSIPGWFQFDLADGVLDRWGKRHDLHVRFENMSGCWNRWLAEENFGSSATTVYENLAFIHGNGKRIEVLAFQSALYDANWNSIKGKDGRLGVNTRKESIAHAYDIRFWVDDAELSYNLYLGDIDVANFIKPVKDTSYNEATDGYYGTWAEGINRIGSYGDVYVTDNTTIQFKDGRIMGSKASDNGPESSLLSRGIITSSPETTMGLRWAGCRCGTSIFRNHSYTIVTKAGAGGSCAQIAGNDPTVEPIDLDQQSISDGVFVTKTSLESVPKNDYFVTIVPEEGYVIDEVTVDGAPIEVTSPDGCAVSLPEISANHVVTATFKPSTTGLRLSKQSANTELTDTNDCYSLEGAVYGVYDDGSCINAVATLTTDAQGNTESIDLSPGTYYLKELQASPGYALDSEVHEVTIELGASNTFTVEEEPQVALVDVVVQKVDADTGEGTPQGQATLAGAEFTLNYYAGYYDADSLPEEPTRRWVVRTDESGVAHLTDRYCIGGDKRYTDADGNTFIPLGTLTTSETKAPAGYTLPSDSVAPLLHIVPDEKGSRYVSFVEPSKDNPTVREPVARGSLKVRKVDSSETGLSGATFDIVNMSENSAVVNGSAFGPHEVCLSITSRSDGVATTGDTLLPVGSYEVHESHAPDGYQIDATWSKRFSITSPGQVVDLTDQPLVNVPQKATVQLKAHKKFEGAALGLSLKKDMFSFELIGPNGSVLQTKRNNANGDVVFDPLTFDQTARGKSFSYAIREVKGDDTRIIYDTHVEKVTVKVTTAKNGTLSASYEADEDGLQFTNQVVPPLLLPRTGQRGHDGPRALAATAACLASLAVILLRRERRNS